jgi:hypothetical protein
VPTPAPAGLFVGVVGNHLVNGAGQPVRLLGVNRAGSSYACIAGWGFFDGPVDDASAAAIASWHANAVRVDLNEDCWLGINGVTPSLSGAAYRAAIVNYVNTLHRHNLYVVLELHWNAPGGLLATGQQPMLDADHAPAFWQSVASTFKNDHAVLFDLYNEPYGISWACWRDGCTSPGWLTAGFQSVVNTVRSTGATQPIMLGGLDWANDLSQWLQYKPSDPQNALVASFHVYDTNYCNNPGCWSVLSTIAQQVPVVTGEMGEVDCGHGFIDSMMAFADARGISYLAWVWDTWGPGCSDISLISNYNGTPTGYGAGLRNHLLAIN